MASNLLPSGVSTSYRHQWRGSHDGGLTALADLTKSRRVSSVSMS